MYDCTILFMLKTCNSFWYLYLRIYKTIRKYFLKSFCLTFAIIIFKYNIISTYYVFLQFRFLKI